MLQPSFVYAFAVASAENGINARGQLPKIHLWASLVAAANFAEDGLLAYLASNSPGVVAIFVEIGGMLFQPRAETPGTRAKDSSFETSVGQATRCGLKI